MRPPEDPLHLDQIPTAQGCARATAGKRAALIAHQGQGAGLESSRGPALLEHGEIPLPAAPESKVLANDHQPSAQLSPEQPGGEDLGAGRRQLLGEGLGDDPEVGVQLAEQLHLAPERCEHRLRATPQHLGGMGMKGEDDHSQTPLCR